MNRSFLLPAVYLVDQIAGDPEWLPHPLRLMGLATTKGEALLRHPDQSNKSELIAGAVLTATVVSASHFLTRLMIAEANRRSKVLGRLTEIDGRSECKRITQFANTRHFQFCVYYCATERPINY
jgi:adenosylcobinamide-phosphate synthase